MKATYEQAGYQGPDQAPFGCGACKHFDGTSACELVDGHIDAQGCCNLFWKGFLKDQSQMGGQPKIAALKAIRGNGSTQPTY